MNSPSRARLSPALTALALVLLVRCAIAASRLDELELELYNGSIASAVLAGLPLSLPELPVIPHARGSVVVGLLLVPLFAVFGATLTVIKAVAIAWSCATAMLFAKLLERAAGARAAYLGAALYAFLPPSFQMVDVIALGSHGDALLLIFAALWLLLEGLRQGPLGWKRSACFGLVCGAGLFFSFQFLVAMPALLLCWALRDPRFALRAASWAAWPSFALAVLPARLFLPPAAGAQTQIVGKGLEQRLLPDGLGGFFDKYADTLGYQLPRSWLFEEHGGAWSGWLWALALLAGLLAAWPLLKRREPLTVFCLAFSLLLVAAYSATDFEMNLVATLDGMGSRYMLPALPALAALVALGAACLKRRWAWVSLASAGLLPGVLGVASLFDPAVALRQSSVRGNEFYLFHGQIEAAAGADLAARRAWIERLAPEWAPWRPLVYDQTLLLCSTWSSPQELERELEAARGAQASERPYLFSGLGSQGGEFVLAHAGEAAPALLAAQAQKLVGQDRQWFLRGLGRAWMRRVIQARPRLGRSGSEGRESGAPLVLSALRQLPAELLPDVLDGMGLQFGLRLTGYELALRATMQELELLPEAARGRLWEAVGKGYRLRFVEQGYRAPESLSLEAYIPGANLERFRAGLAAPHERF